MICHDTAHGKCRTENGRSQFGHPKFLHKKSSSHTRDTRGGFTKGAYHPPAWYYFFYCKRIMPFPWSLHPEYITRTRGMQYFMLYNYGKSGWAVPTRSPTQKALRRGALFCRCQSTKTASLYSSGMVMPRISALVLLMMTVRSFGSCTGIVSGFPLPSRMSAAMSPA